MIIFYILFCLPFVWFIIVDLNLTPIKIIWQQYSFTKTAFKKKPEIWINKSPNTPSFKHWSVVVRWIFWYVGIQVNHKRHNAIKHKYLGWD